jgi:TonB family protein
MQMLARRTHKRSPWPAVVFGIVLTVVLFFLLLQVNHVVVRKALPPSDDEAAAIEVVDAASVRWPIAPAASPIDTDAQAGDPVLDREPDEGSPTARRGVELAPGVVAGRAWTLGGVDGLDLVWSVESLDRAPEALVRIAPIFPGVERGERAAGTALIRFVVDERGAVRDARVDVATSPVFGRAALEAIVGWRFAPGMKDGRSVRTRMVQAFRFSAEP